MHIASIRERVANGFKPFLLRLSNGRRIPVPHPDFIALGSRAVVVIDKKDHSSKIDVLHIVSIEDLPRARRKAARR
jgi:hypothetical protein